MNKDLLNYITEHLAEGFSPQEIKQELIKTGWPESQINYAINTAVQKSPPTKSSKIIWILIPVILLIIAGGISALVLINEKHSITEILTKPTIPIQQNQQEEQSQTSQTTSNQTTESQQQDQQQTQQDSSQQSQTTQTTHSTRHLFLTDRTSSSLETDNYIIKEVCYNAIPEGILFKQTLKPYKSFHQPLKKNYFCPKTQAVIAATKKSKEIPKTAG